MVKFKMVMMGYFLVNCHLDKATPMNFIFKFQVRTKERFLVYLQLVSSR